MTALATLELIARWSEWLTRDEKNMKKNCDNKLPGLTQFDLPFSCSFTLRELLAHRTGLSKKRETPPHLRSACFATDKQVRLVFQ